MYDAENRMVSATNTSSQQSIYTYDADGRRVRRNSYGQETWQAYGMDGELLAEYAANAAPSSPQKEYGYRNGQLLIIAASGSGLASITPTAPEAAATEGAAIAASSDLKANLSAHLLAKNSSFATSEWSREKSVGSISDTSPPLFPLLFTDASPALLPPQSSSGQIVFTSNRDGSAQLYLMNSDGSNQTRLTNTSANDESPRWSPDNSHILFQSDRDNPFSGAAEIYLMNSDATAQTRLTNNTEDDSFPVWSPAGNKIAFQSLRNDLSYQVYVMNSDGSNQINLSNSTSADGQPSWSPDGTKIAFTSERDHPGTPSIYVMNADGSNQTRLTFSAATIRDEQPSWSPDGTKLLFTSTRDSVVESWQETDDNGGIIQRTAVRTNKEVYVMNSNGSNQIRLTNNLENDDSPVWSNDGTKIVFRSERERDGCDPVQQVWVMDADGSNQVDLSNSWFGDYCPNWQRVAGSNLPPTVSLTSPTSNATFSAPASMTIAANASDSDGIISKVEFYQGTTLIGTDTTAPYTVSWNNISSGSYQLTAKAIDNVGAASVSNQVNITVSAPSSTADISWIVTDQLGTPRMIVDRTGRLNGIKRHDYLPFGEEVSAGTGGRTTAHGYSGTDDVRQKFTGSERDNETGLDFMQARYFSSTQGRFTLTDPLYYQAMMAIDPQRFNLYAYARNNPLKFTDSNGEKVYLRGDSDWLRTNVLYEMVGGQKTFDRYFQITNGQVVLRDSVDLTNAVAGVQLLGELVNSTDNYLYYAGTNGTEAAGLFQGSFGTNKKGELKSTDTGQVRIKRFEGTISGESGGEGTLIGTRGRGESTLQPANLANGDPVYCVIAYNTRAVQEQTAISYAYPIELEAQREGLG